MPSKTTNCPSSTTWSNPAEADGAPDSDDEGVDWQLLKKYWQIL